MATIQKYATPNTIETVLSTGLNSLGNGGAMAVSAAIDNATDLYPFADIEIVVANSLSAGDYISLYLDESADGTNYEDTGAMDPGSGGSSAQLICSFIINRTASRHIIRGVTLPPKKFKVVFLNATSSALAASGNTVKMIRYGLQNT